MEENGLDLQDLAGIMGLEHSGATHGPGGTYDPNNMPAAGTHGPQIDAATVIQ